MLRFHFFLPRLSAIIHLAAVCYAAHTAGWNIAMGNIGVAIFCMVCAAINIHYGCRSTAVHPTPED